MRPHEGRFSVRQPRVRNFRENEEWTNFVALELNYSRPAQQAVKLAACCSKNKAVIRTKEEPG